MPIAYMQMMAYVCMRICNRLKTSNMENSLTNASGILLLKSHKAIIFKHAAKLADKHSNVSGAEVELNKNTTAVFNLTVLPGILDVQVTQVKKA
jgi:predicted HTH domain antitoxin